MQFQDDLAGGIFLIRPALRSPDYVAGVSGWTINIDGSAEFNDVTVRGTLESSNYVPGVSGWRLDEAGSAEFNDVTIRGDGNGDVLVVGPAGAPQVIIGSDPTIGYVHFPSGEPIETSPGRLRARVLNGGDADEQLSLSMFSPEVSGDPGQASIELLSGHQDGSGLGPGIELSVGNSLFYMNDGFLQLTGMRIIGGQAAATDRVYETSVITDTVEARWSIRADGRQRWSSGAAAFDTELYRSGAGELTTPGDLTVGGELAAANIQSGSFQITPTVANEWTANVAVVFPDAFATTPTVVLTCTAGAPNPATTTELEYAAASVTTTGFNARIRRGNLTATTLSWLAVSTP